MRTELTAARANLQEAAVRHADVTARQQSEIEGLAHRLRAADAEREQRSTELASVRNELTDAIRRAERAETEVEVTRRLAEDLRRAPAEKPADEQGPES